MLADLLSHSYNSYRTKLKLQAEKILTYKHRSFELEEQSNYKSKHLELLQKQVSYLERELKEIKKRKRELEDANEELTERNIHQKQQFYIY